MAQAFSTTGLNLIAGSGLGGETANIYAYQSGTLLSEAEITFGNVDYDFSEETGNPTISFGPVVLEGFENGDVVDEITIGLSTTSSVWTDDEVSITFTSSGSLTIDGTFTLGGGLSDKAKAAILEYGLSAKSGNLTLTGTNVPATNTDDFSFTASASNGGINQTGQVDFPVLDGTVVEGVDIEVDFPSPAGLIEIGSVTRSPSLSFDGSSTCTVSNVRVALGND